MRVLDPHIIKKRLDRELGKEGFEPPKFDLFRVDTKLTGQFHRYLFESLARFLGKEETIRNLKKKMDECLFDTCYGDRREKEYKEYRKQLSAEMKEVIDHYDNVTLSDLNKYAKDPEFPNWTKSADELLEDFEKNRYEILERFVNPHGFSPEDGEKVQKFFKETVRVTVEVGEEEDD